MKQKSPVARLCTALLVATVVASSASVAFAQSEAVEALFPATIGDFNIVEHYSESGQPLYGHRHFSGLPTFREGAAYASESGNEVHVGLIIVNEAFPRVLGIATDDASLQLVNFSHAELTPREDWFEASVEENPDEMIFGRSIVARPLTANALLIVETFSPNTASMDEIRSILQTLDVDALTTHSRTHSGVHSSLWGLLQSFPSELGDHGLAGYHIESAGNREPIISLNALYGDPEEPAIALVVTAAGAGMTNIELTYPFDPSAGLAEKTFGTRRAFDGVMQDVGGLVIVDEHAWVALFHLSETSQSEERLALAQGLDIEGLFRVASEYRAESEAEAPASEPESSEMRLVSWAHVLEADVIATIIDIGDEHIEFSAGHPQLEDFDLMDILVSYQEAHPFLRRVVSIENRGETVLVETRPASLEEAVAPR